MFEKLFDKDCLNQKALEGRLGKNFVCCPSQNLPHWKEGWPALLLDRPGRIKGHWDPCCSTEIGNILCTLDFNKEFLICINDQPKYRLLIDFSKSFISKRNSLKTFM